MDYDVVDAQYVTGYTIRLHFRDGISGEVDLASELTGPIFQPLRDVGLFRQFSLDPTWHLVRVGSSQA